MPCVAFVSRQGLQESSLRVGGGSAGDFTIKELRELTNLKTSRFRVDQAEFLGGETEASVSEVKDSPKKRLYALMKENCCVDGGEDESKAKSLPEVSLRFLLLPSPLKPTMRALQAQCGSSQQLSKAMQVRSERFPLIPGRKST